jgi:hypothetical protein
MAFLVGIVLAIGGCDPGEAPLFGSNPADIPDPDPQFIKIFHQYSFRDTLDTFHGRLTKDLILDGTVTIWFWLTTAEQESLQVELEREQFFAMPDTLFPIPGMDIDPNPSPDVLRVEAGGVEKTVVWIFPLEPSLPHNQSILRLSAAIRRIVESRKEYKQLPQPRGGYL